MGTLFQYDEWSLAWSIGVFTVATVCIAIAGWQLATKADRLADRTGMGEALAGAVLMGSATSISGIVTSATAAWDGLAELSVSNALGGIAAQTTFLAVADAFHRSANLEHAAASAANMMQAGLLITLLSIALVAMLGPDVTYWSVHPATVLLLIAYPYGLQMVRAARTDHLWEPDITDETRTDQPSETPKGESLKGLWLTFAGLAAVVGTAGWFLEKAAAQISAQAGISQSVVGGLFTAVTTSLPELVTSISAVRRGALTLAVSGIIGGCAFDMMFLVVSDLAYREGSIYHAAPQSQQVLTAVTIVMNGILLMGLIRREKRGIWNIGLESFLILICYVMVVALLVFG